MTTTQLEMPLAVRLWPRLAADTRYVLTGLPLAVASFAVCLTALTAGLTLAVVWVGVPLVVFALMQARGFAASERARLALPAPAYREAFSPARHHRLLATVSDPRSWRDLAHAALRFIPNTISASLVLTWWLGLLGSVTWALWGWSLPNGPDDADLPQVLGLGDSYTTSVVFYLMVAAAFALTLPAVAHAAARLEAAFARALLG